MKIFYFAFAEKIPSGHAGTVHTLEMITQLKKLNHEVILFCKEGEHVSTDYNYVHFPIGFKELVLTNYWTALKDLYRLFKLARVYKPDLIYERWAHPDIFSLILAKILKLPRILEVNGPVTEEIHDFPCVYFISRILRKWQFKNSVGIITQTNTLRSILLKFTKTPVYLVPNGADTHKFKPNLPIPKIMKGMEGKIIITFVGSFTQWHGAYQIPSIINRILPKYPNILFLLVGSGPDFTKVKALITPQIKENIRLLGSVSYSMVPAILANSNILIAPFDANNYKPFQKNSFWWSPVKLFEYMAAGKPIVSYNYQEVEAITGKNNLLCPPNDLNCFCDNIEILLEDKALCKKIGESNRKFAVENYDWHKRALLTQKIIYEFV